MKKRVQLYMRPGCHLCSDAAAMLQRLGCDVEEINIEEDPQLLLRYTDTVPVLSVEGRDLLAGLIREGDVRAVLTTLSDNRLA